ncbi:MAG: hypothetical protein EXR71_14500 [Myxococcales bacterium]|nr:hypothetical protein [Myxococcales bacterium]
MAVLLAWPYIELGAAVPIGSWQADAPIADVAVLAFLPLALLRLWRGPLPPGAVGYAVMLGAGLAAGLATADGAAALHELVRKPLFSGLVYGLGLAAFVAQTAHLDVVRRGLLVAIAACACISLTTSVGRIIAGDTLWFHAIGGLTGNHKTLAVALAPALPLIWGWEAPAREARIQRGVVVLAGLALAASLSRTAWISAALAATYFIVVGGRVLAARRALVPALLLVGLWGATYLPLYLPYRSITLIDALRSRHSIDLRSWSLFAAHPLVGASPGASVRTELSTFPHYRVNGVDAHGAVQKVAAEYGLIGLCGFVGFVYALGRTVRSRHRDGDGCWPAFVALHGNLLLSTETFSQTHWVVLGVVLGLTERQSRTS